MSPRRPCLPLQDMAGQLRNDAFLNLRLKCLKAQEKIQSNHNIKTQCTNKPIYNKQTNKGIPAGHGKAALEMMRLEAQDNIQSNKHNIKTQCTNKPISNKQTKIPLQEMARQLRKEAFLNRLEAQMLRCQADCITQLHRAEQLHILKYSFYINLFVDD